MLPVNRLLFLVLDAPNSERHEQSQNFALETNWVTVVDVPSDSLPGVAPYLAGGQDAEEIAGTYEGG